MEVTQSTGFLSGIMMWLIPIVALVVVILGLIKQYKICPNDKLMVVYGVGSGDKEKGAKIIRGGATFVVPFLQQYKFMSLAPISIDINLTDALSSNNIRVQVPAQFTLAVDSTDDANMQNAVRHLLDLTSSEIQENAENIIFGSLRAAVSEMSIEELTRDRNKFIELVNKNVGTELNKIGMDVVNVNIKDIRDESGYIEALGKKAAAEAINKAEVDVAEQERSGAIGVETNKREQEITVAKQKARGEMGVAEADREKTVRVAELQAETVKGENESKANIADSNAELNKREASAYQSGEVARAQAETKVSEEQRIAEQAKLAKETLPAAEVEKSRIEIDAEAKAEETRRIAQGNADAKLLEFKAEAEGIQLVLEAKAAGYKDIVAAANNDPRAAATLLLIEKMEDIMEIQVEALKGINIDKITVWDSGNGSNGGNGGVKGFLGNFMTSIPQMHELAQQAGIELPSYLGSTAEEGNTEMSPANKQHHQTAGGAKSENDIFSKGKQPGQA